MYVMLVALVATTRAIVTVDKIAMELDWKRWTSRIVP
jgi:hypothetical protein